LLRQYPCGHGKYSGCWNQSDRRTKVAAVLDEILESFYVKLSESEAVSEATVGELRALLESGLKLKADDFVAILEKVAEEPIRDSD
jgi:hypothetical protein